MPHIATRPIGLNATVLAAGLLTIAPVVFLIAPRSAPALLGAVVLALAALAWPPPRELLGNAGLGLTIAAALGTWLLVTLLWSADPKEGLGKAALFAAFALAVWVAGRSISRLPAPVVTELARGAVIGVAIGIGYLLIEEVSHHALKRTVFTLLPWTRLPERHLGIAGDDVQWVAAYASNRSMAALVLALWPVLLAAGILFGRRRAALVSGGLLIASALAIALSDHDTSAVALAAGAAAFPIAWRWPRVALGLLGAGWLAASLLIVPATYWAYHQAGLHEARALPHSGRQRIILWGYTAERVGERPLLGVGIAATKRLDDARGPAYPQPPGHVYPLRTGPHAHNVYLQVWYELGAIGAALFSALGLAVLAAISRMPAAARPYLAAAFVSAALTGAFSWGLWQAWFMAAFALSAVLGLLGAELARLTEATSGRGG